jgi:methyl-accepting chemotaxis protein
VTILARLRIGTKLTLLLGLSALAVVTLIGIAALQLHQRMIDDRVTQLRTAVQMASGLAMELEKQVAGGQLTHEAALGQLRTSIHVMHFANGAGYTVFQSSDGIVLAHGGIPALEGKSPIGRDINGRTTNQLGLEALRDADEGVIAYSQKSPGESNAIPRISFVARFAPWKAMVFASARSDDLDADLRASLLHLSSIGGAILLVTLVAAWWINRDIAVSLKAVTGAMEHLAKGDLTTDAPGADRKDEIGSLARALLVFRENGIEMGRMTAAQEQLKHQAEADQKAALHRMADNFEGEVGQLVEQLAAGAAQWQGAAESMAGAATLAGEQAMAVASAAEEASAGVQSVASATEELTASIVEIGRLVAQSAAITGNAVADARRTDSIVRALNDGAGKIGHVVGLITNIARQTNLLALNATIEAAHAGDAGKGFAVVASEVKSLASQTSSATEEISVRITQIQAATAEAVEAIRGITATIEQVGGNATAIASAVEEQGTATAEIARNVQQTAQGTEAVTANIAGVSQSAKETGATATKVLGAADDLSKQTEQLSRKVNVFVGRVRAA